MAAASTNAVTPNRRRVHGIPLAFEAEEATKVD
jgi:hypothetical protein